MKNLVLWVSVMIPLVLTNDDDRFSLDQCLDSVNHKRKPSSEDKLHKQCSPWKDRACCNSNTTELAHTGNLYNLNFDHCGIMSEECKQHFIQDLCFYECEPNLSPWFVKINMKYRKQRLSQVPLCATDCESWFKSCENDRTCVEKWTVEFIWKDNVKSCPIGKECKTFKDIYKNASNFCEKVWDESWKYTPDTEPCMRLWFNGSKGNPNQKVAEIKIRELINTASSMQSSLLSLLMFTVIWYQCNRY